MIGIVGGIGPLAGADLYRRIVENTVAETDQEHLPVLLASLPHKIVDRTSYLLGRIAENPAPALADVIILLHKAGAQTIGIACNTAHAIPIFDPIVSLLQEKGCTPRLIHMIEETIRAIQQHPKKIKRIGVLSTSGTYQTRLYPKQLEAAGLLPVLLSLERHEALSQRAIYEIKKYPEAIPQMAITRLNTAFEELKSLGAEAVILGCTELGMIAHHLNTLDLEVFNPNNILARALIAATYPHQLKP